MDASGVVRQPISGNLGCYTRLMIPGFATSEGTARYRDRFPKLREAGHFRRPQGVPEVGDLWFPSIGLGTYLGEPTAQVDAQYQQAITAALRSGINLLDTAINYRHQRSERNIGAALAELIASGELRRDEVLVCTKAGFLAFDGEMPADMRGYFMREYVQTGILDPQQVAGGSHCMAPRYLADQIERSRRNLGLETIDVFYIHNPESQLAEAGEVERPVFRQRLQAAFTMLEDQVKEAKIRYYGVATWHGLRRREEERDYISLAALLDMAHAAGGEQHHFRFLQLPFNLGMTEAFARANQLLDGESMSVIKMAARAGMAVVGSATLHQGQLIRNLPGFVSQALGMASDAGNAIQFSRSAPGLTTSLIGMSTKDHVLANLEPAFHPPTPPEQWAKLFGAR
ncbi:MAG TPA: aldo/keto reductase [Terriglobales bacterium]|nr:aldo/keto reductase [Terriglobales bacterium]